MGQGSCVGRIYYYYVPKQEKLVFHPNFNHPLPVSSHQTCVMVLSSVTIKQCVQNIHIKQLSAVHKDWEIIYNEEELQSLNTLFGSTSFHFQLHCARERTINVPHGPTVEKKCIFVLKSTFSTDQLEHNELHVNVNNHHKGHIFHHL